jgi:hypothetical protein
MAQPGDGDRAGPDETSTTEAGLPDEPADHGICASVVRRAAGGPFEAEPAADAGPAAPQGAALINYL